MARKISHVALVSAVLISACLKTSVADWASDLTHNINQQVRQYTENLQEEIQRSVQNSLRPALAEVNRAIENLPRDANGRIIQSVTGGSSIIINSGNGVSRTILSGHTSDGEPYTRDIEERREGDFLYHKEIFYKPKTNSSEIFRWKLDLATPGAKPEIIANTN